MLNKLDNNKEKAIWELLHCRILDDKDLMRNKRLLARKYSIGIPSNADVLRFYREMVEGGYMKRNEGLEPILRKRAVRTMSGIAPVAVLTKPYGCPGECAYCPTEKDVPQSYLSNEPAVMRAIRCNYNPYVQVQDRLRALIANGHEPTKIELIVIGGTWSYFPRKYKYWYIANCFAAANEFDLKLEIRNQKLGNKIIKSPFVKGVPDRAGDLASVNNHKPKTKYSLNLSIKDLQLALQKEQKKNEKAKYNIIGLTLETRPDYINEKELIEMRELGCTRVELGVQAIDDEILKLNKRGHGVAEIADATKLLRSFGFKITYHLMPGLPGSNLKRDLEMHKQYFIDPRFQPDQIKFYPTVVTKGSLLYKWWKQGKYKPYSDENLQKLIIDCKKATPPYVRIIRLIRDIPGESIVDGNKITNLRQVMKDKGVECSCIRCREAKDTDFQKDRQKNMKLKIRKYKVTGGEEQFVSFESSDGKVLYGFVRLFLPEIDNNDLLGLNDSAIIRELHVYGQLVVRGGDQKVQHAGLGKKLMAEAEKQAKSAKFRKMAVISGVGVRGYYRKLGYRLSETYMVKNLTK